VLETEKCILEKLFKSNDGVINLNTLATKNNSTFLLAKNKEIKEDKV